MVLTILLPDRRIRPTRCNSTLIKRTDAARRERLAPLRAVSS